MSRDIEGRLAELENAELLRRTRLVSGPQGPQARSASRGDKQSARR